VTFNPQLYQTLQSPDHVGGTDYINQLPDSLRADSMLAIAPSVFSFRTVFPGSV
jgi:hypothetical protein